MSQENPAWFKAKDSSPVSGAEAIQESTESKKDELLESILHIVQDPNEQAKAVELRQMQLEWIAKLPQQVDRKLAWKPYVDSFVTELTDGYGFEMDQLKSVVLFHMINGSTLDQNLRDVIKSFDLPNGQIETFIRENYANIDSN